MCMNHQVAKNPFHKAGHRTRGRTLQLDLYVTSSFAS